MGTWFVSTTFGISLLQAENRHSQFTRVFFRALALRRIGRTIAEANAFGSIRIQALV
jgi:hypothetical protein